MLRIGHGMAPGGLAMRQAPCPQLRDGASNRQMAVGPIKAAANGRTVALFRRAKQAKLLR
jgi:hypothetical protein